MKISYNWLKEYINIDLAPDEVAKILTDTGLEVEGVEEIETVKGGLHGVVIGHILSCKPHPNADRLVLTKVDIGGENPLQIVCGAPNVAEGQKVPVATVGTTMYLEDGSFEIKKTKLRGEISEGMICSESELGLGTSHKGIMVLAEAAVPGTAAAEYFKIGSDYVFEIGLTPNRTDAMSHFGVARDLRAALIRQGQQGVEAYLPSITSFSVSAKDLPVEISIENEAACARYTGISLKNVQVTHSPEWLQNRLRAIGVAPINNVVDITNYVLHETGHPMHSFDLDQIAGQKIVVKQLPAGTKFITLDDKERELHGEDLMICDEEKGLVLAGIFGGKKSRVTESTKRVFLEAAWFDPVYIRKSAKRHGLNTDSSFRYERGVDPELTLYALQRAATLIRDIAGGEISMAIKDVQPRKIEGADVQLNLGRMNQLIGQEIPRDLVRSILNALDIKIKTEGNEDMLLAVPAYRSDVRREADVIEEVLRIYGFNEVLIPKKMEISVAQNDLKSPSQYRTKTSISLSSSGFQEIMNNSLTRPDYYRPEWGYKPEECVEMINPLSRDLSVMRQSMVFGGLESVARNINRQRPNLQLYEFGKVYRKRKKHYGENLRLGIWICGQQQPENWKEKQQPTDFYYLKSTVESILYQMGIEEWGETDTSDGIFEFGLDLTVNKNRAISLGKIKPAVTQKTDVKQDVFFADLDWDALAAMARKKTIRFTELPKYPEVRRDLALLLDKNIRYTDLRRRALETERRLLKKVNLFDVYEGKKLPDGKKSYALSFILRDDDKTLNDQQVEKVMAKILQNFQREFAAELR